MIFDFPDATPIAEAEPIAALTRVVERPGDSGGLSLALTPDVRAFCGGTAYMPTTDAIATGDPPAPWQAPIAHADRRVGATRGAFFVL